MLTCHGRNECVCVCSQFKSTTKISFFSYQEFQSILYVSNKLVLVSCYFMRKFGSSNSDLLDEYRHQNKHLRHVHTSCMPNLQTGGSVRMKINLLFNPKSLKVISELPPAGSQLQIEVQSNVTAGVKSSKAGRLFVAQQLLCPSAPPGPHHSPLCTYVHKWNIFNLCE